MRCSIHESGLENALLLTVGSLVRFIRWTWEHNSVPTPGLDILRTLYPQFG